MVLTLTISYGETWLTRQSVFEREVDWPSLPDVGDILLVGKRESEEETSLNARIVSRYFTTSHACVDARIEYTGDYEEEYESFCADIVRDGFRLVSSR